MKRLDTSLMLIVAYTTICGPDEAKILVFPIISGLFLAVSNWQRPYVNVQAGILDFLESVLLTSRFVLFSTVAVLLILHPTKTTVWVFAACLLVMLTLVIVSCGIHIVIQFMRHTTREKEDEDSELVAPDEKGNSDGSGWCSCCERVFSFCKRFSADVMKDVKALANRLKKALKRRVADLLQIFEPDEPLVMHWIWGTAIPTASMDRRSSTTSISSMKPMSIAGKFLIAREMVATNLSRCMWMLKLGTKDQHRAICTAFRDFTELWLRHFEGETIPSVNVLCALAVSGRCLPSKIASHEIEARWEQEIKRIATSDEKQLSHRLSLHDFEDAVQRFSVLPKDHAVNLMKLGPCS